MRVCRFAQILCLIIIVAALVSCETQKGRIPSPDWSRGLPLGSLGRGSIGMAVEADSKRIHLAWPDLLDGESSIRYMQLDDQANPTVDNHLPLVVGEKRAPRLAFADEGRLHFLWGGRENGRSNWQLNYAQLNATGELLNDPITLSDPEVKVGSYQISLDHDGGVFVAWEADNAIYVTHVTKTGIPDDTPVLVAENGAFPAMRLDAEGALRLVWREADRILYAQMDGANLKPASKTVIADVELGTGAVIDGPTLGLSAEWGYVIWSISNRSGLEAGTSYVQYVAFPINVFESDHPTRIGFSGAEELPYEAYLGDYQLTVLAPPVTSAYSTNFAFQPTADQGRENEVAVALALNQLDRQHAYTQIGVAIFREGTFAGFNMASKTEAYSQEAIIQSDAAGNLHTAWREGGQGQMIFYATTTPDARAAINSPSVSDVSGVLFTGAVEGAVGMMLFPLAFIWVTPGILLLGIWHMRRDEDTLTDPFTLVLLVVAFISYHVVKILFWPFITIYVPFSAWMDIPDAWALPLQIGVPIVIFGIGLLVGWRQWRKRPYMSGLMFFFIVAIVDALLTLGVYGVNFLGVF